MRTLPDKDPMAPWVGIFIGMKWGARIGAALILLVIGFLFGAASSACAQTVQAAPGSMSIDFDVFLKIVPILLSIGAIVVAFFGSRRKYVEERFKDGSKRMDRHDLRLVALEERITTLPSKDDVHGIELKMTEVTGTLHALHTIMESNAKAMDRIEAAVIRHEEQFIADARGQR